MPAHVPPSLSEMAFNCPHCEAFAKQDWHRVMVQQPSKTSADQSDKDLVQHLKISASTDDASGRKAEEHLRQLQLDQPTVSSASAMAITAHHVRNVWFSNCHHCHTPSVWIGGTLAYPIAGAAPPPAEEMPKEVKFTYLEASSVLNLSPRAASGLLRLALQQLCKELNQPGKNLHTEIGNLIKGGLDPEVAEAFDVIRIVGNDAVHPSYIGLGDDREVATSLFELLNYIVQEAISRPAQRKRLADRMPAAKRRKQSNRTDQEEA